mgnify:FL=1
MAVLAVGVVTAILTTKDTTWWTLHFSQLGTVGDFSARTFNTTVIVSGSLLAVYGVVIGMTLPATTGRHTRRGLRGSLVTAGLAMTVVGLIPIPVSVVMHDLAASTLGLSFLSLVAWSLGLPGLPRVFRRFTLVFVIVLATGIVVLTAGFITLALFEFTAFSVVGCWLVSLPRVLRTQAELSDAVATEHVDVEAKPETAAVSEMPATRVVQPHRRHRLARAVRPARRNTVTARTTESERSDLADPVGLTRPAVRAPRAGRIAQRVTTTGPTAHRGPTATERAARVTIPLRRTIRMRDDDVITLAA